MGIAIIGMACRVPGANDLEQFWKNLLSGTCSIGVIPESRWDADEYYDPNPDTPGKMNTRHGGFLDRVDQFDAEFWRITAREAARMDPQHRLLLEVTFEALEDAGLTREELAGTKTGVWVGLSSYDYGRAQAVGEDDPFAGYCSAFSIAANRMSYLFDWRGPSLTVDTACSSSLVGVHLACRSLLSGETDCAIVAGANLVLLPDLLVTFSNAGMLAPDALCKAFSAQANGYGRSDGVGVVVLRREADAVASGDRCYATIRGSAVNQDGRSNGLTAPNPLAQQAVLEEAYRDAAVAPELVGYLEAHGTGTPLGDPIEAKAAASLLTKHRDRDATLLLGSVKTNLGHLESAAGVAGLIKTALGLHHETIPPSLHFTSPNPHIDFEGLKLAVPTSVTPWPEQRPYAGVSAFGYGGTNAHVVLAKATRSVPLRRDERAQLILLSARTRSGVARLAARLADTELDDASLPALAATSASRRTHHGERLGVVARTREELRDRLAAFVKEGDAEGCVAGSVQPRRKRVAFLCGGNGGAWVGMGQSLLGSEAVFRHTIERCDTISREHDVSVLALLERPTHEAMRSPRLVQPVLCALQLALAEWWKSVGVVPSVVLGQSLGEVTASALCGALDLETAVRVACLRGACLESAIGRGSMLAVGVSAEEAEELCRDQAIVVAGYNTPSSQVLSGDQRSLVELAERLRARGVRVHDLGIPFPSHSPFVEEVSRALYERLSDLRWGSATLPWISTVEPERSQFAADATYFARNVREPVRFLAAARRLVEHKIDTVIEIGPHPLLLPFLSDIEEFRDVAFVPSMIREREGRQVLLQGLASLWTRGHSTRFAALSYEQPVVPLPTYPWEHKRHWHASIRRPSLSVPSSRHAVWSEPFCSAEPLGHRYSSAQLTASAGSLFSEHRVAGRAVVPGAAMIDGLLFVGANRRLCNVELLDAIELSDEALALQLHQVDESDRSAFYGNVSLLYRTGSSGWVRAATADVPSEARPVLPEVFDRAVFTSDAEVALDWGELYEGYAGRGLEYGERFRRLRRAIRNGSVALGELLPGDESERAGFVVHPAELDSCFHLIGALLPETAFPACVLLPTRVREVVVAPNESGRAETQERSLTPLAIRFTRVELEQVNPKEGTKEGGVTASVHCFDEHGRPLLVLRGLELRAVELDARPKAEWLLETKWEVLAEALPGHERSDTDSRKPSFAVYCDQTDLGERLCSLLQRQGRPARVGHFGEDDEHRTECKLLLVTDRQRGAQEEGEQEIVRVEHALTLARQARTTREPGHWLLVTRCTQPVLESDRVTTTGAALWGVGRTLRLECPELSVTCLDLPGEADDATNLELLAASLARLPDEDQLALRRDESAKPRWYAARLRPVESFPWNQHPAITGTALVTGGLGALGVRAAERCARAGADTVVLWSRSEPNERARRVIASIEASGVRVRVQAVDVADADRVQAAIRELSASEPPIRTVIHAAGVVDNAFLQEQNPERVRRALLPKVNGASNLLRFLPTAELSRIVFYSSIAGAMGSPGQANYAAGNAWLESYARQLSAQGIGALSIAWSAWAEAGLAAQAETWSERIASFGFSAFAPEAGDALLDAFLANGRQGVAVVPLNRKRLVRVLGARVPSLLKELVNDAKRTSGTTADRIDWENTPAEQLPGLLEARLKQIVASATGTSASAIVGDVGFDELGIDSMLRVQMQAAVQRQFGVNLPAELLHRHPTLNDVVEFLGQRLGKRPQVDSAVAATGKQRGERALAVQPQPANGKIRSGATTTAASSVVPTVHCFAHAGGTVAGYVRLQRRVVGVQLVGMEMPGRGRRDQEPPVHEWNGLITDFCTQLTAEESGQVALFGHSLGALIAFECARELTRRGHAIGHLFVAGLKAPHLLRARSVEMASDEALIERLRPWGGVPDAIEQSTELRSLLLSRVRDDLHLFDAYHYRSSAPLDCPITVLFGTEDPGLGDEQILPWRQHTTGPVEIHRFDGGHFFLEQHADNVAALIRRTMGNVEVRCAE